MEIKYMEIKFYLSKSSGYSRAPCKIKPVFFSPLYTNQKYKLRLLQISLNFRGYLAKSDLFHATLTQGVSILCLSESLNLPLIFQSISRAILIINNCVITYKRLSDQEADNWAKPAKLMLLRAHCSYAEQIWTKAGKLFEEKTQKL